MRSIFLKNKKVIIVAHEATTGPGRDLLDFLNDQKAEILFISHPLLFLPENYKNSSRYELYQNGKLVKTGKAFHWQMSEPLLYIKDVLYTLFWSIRLLPKVDIFVGVGNLNAFAGLPLRLIGQTKVVIYYVIDYVPVRFKNKILNTIYHGIEKISALRCDWTWNLSPRMIEGREKKWHRKFPHQIIVPHGVHFERIKRVSFENTNKQELLFMGALLEKQGVQLVIQTMPQILKKIPKAVFTIIGRGPYEPTLKDLVGKLKLEKNVHFLGHFPDHKAMENRIAKASIALALYNRDLDENDFTYYADPGKVKNYLGAGVPVIITDVPYIAREVAKARCGFVVNYNKKDLEKVIVSFFSDPDTIKEYKKNAIAFAKKYRWETIFSDALGKVYDTK